MKSYLFKTFLLFVLILTASFAFSDEKKKDDPWVTMEERVKIWDEVVSNNDK